MEAEKKGEKSIVYDDLVKGSGLILFSALLDFLGFKKFKLITSETTTVSEISKIQKYFNEDVTGEKISVILGSRIIAEGFTFSDVIHEHLVPHWNNTETMQVVARGIRMGSHNKILKLKPNISVKIYRHVSLCDTNDKKLSVDYIMTKLSENKDIEINKIIDCIKEVSLTCNEFIKRNKGTCRASPPSFYIRDNLSSVGFLEEYIFKKIMNFFSEKTYAHLNVLSSELKIKKEELIPYLFYMLSEKINFKNNKGVKCYLNNINNYYFVTENIRTERDLLMSFYTQDLKPYTENFNYKDIVEQEIEDYNSNKNKQRLLEIALTVKLYNLKVKDYKKVEEILEKFKNNWYIDENKKIAFAWYLSDIVEEKSYPMCLYNAITDKPWMEWTKCNKQLKNEIMEKRFGEIYDFEKKLINKKINYYGLWNPILNEFCIKNIDINNNKNDKRKISSGKRCVNWKKEELEKISRDELKMQRDWPEWIKKNRNLVCEDIKNYLSQNNLLLENKSCGVQTKRK